MNKRLLALSIALVLVIGLFGVLILVSATNTNNDAEIFTRVTVGNTPATEVRVGDVFNVSFYVRNFDSVMSISVPVWYDYTLVELLDKNGNRVHAETPRGNVFYVNTIDFSLVGSTQPYNANYPRFDTDDGNFRLWLQESRLVTGEEVHLFSVQFRALAVGQFEIEIDPDYASNVGMSGAVIFPHPDADGSAPQRVIRTMDAAPLTIIVGPSRPPENVIIHPHTGEDYYTVVVSRNPESS